MGKQVLEERMKNIKPQNKQKNTKKHGITKKRYFLYVYLFSVFGINIYIIEKDIKVYNNIYKKKCKTVTLFSVMSHYNSETLNHNPSLIRLPF